MLLTLQEWEHTRNRDLADLYFYSLTFKSPDSDKYLARWHDTYGEIDSLFYFKKDCFKKENDIIMPTFQYILTSHRAYKFQHQNLDFYQNLNKKGLIFHNLLHLVSFSIRNDKLDVFDYLFSFLKPSEKILNLLTSSMVGQSNLPMLESLIYKNRQSKILSDNKAYAYMLGYSIMPQNLMVQKYIKNMSDYSQVLQALKEILNDKPQTFLINTKTGQDGHPDEITKFISQEFSLVLSGSLENKDLKKVHKI